MRVPRATLVTPVVSALTGLPLAVGLLALSAVLSSCAESPTSPSTTGGTASPATTSGTPTSPSTSTPPNTAGSTSTTGKTDTPQMGYSLHFAGTGSPDVDRVNIPIDPNAPADVGRDFTLEFWLKAEPGANATSTCQAGSDGWTYGNVVLDRDIAGDGDFGEYGVSVSGGRIAFGLGRSGRTQTLCGLIDVADGRWHHVALTRRASDGQMRIYVDGTESAQGVGPVGDISYRDGRPTRSSQDPFLIVGAAKREANDSMQGFSGWIDELRISSRVRYSAPFDRPVGAFTSDADTTLLLHFDEGPTGPCASSVMDTSGRATHGQCRHGGNVDSGPAYTTDVPFMPASPRQSRSWILGNQPGAPTLPSSPATATAPIPPR